MKKIGKIVMFIAFLIGIPMHTYAKSYTALNLEETLKKEKIDYDLSDYKETSNQITIYMFRGDRCGYCQNFLNFLKDNVKEYGKYFKLRSFEIWHNENNAALMKEVAQHFNKSVKGVPLIVIGEKTFQGYTSSYDKELIEIITNYYNNKETYKDVVSDFLVEKEETTTGAAITILVLVTSIAGLGFLLYSAKEKTPITEEKTEEINTNENKKETAKKTEEQGKNESGKKRTTTVKNTSKKQAEPKEAPKTVTKKQPTRKKTTMGKNTTSTTKKGSKKTTTAESKKEATQKKNTTSKKKVSTK